MIDYNKIYTRDYFTGKGSVFWIGGYGNNFGFGKRYFTNLFKPFQKYITSTRNAKVLDVGCAYGYILEKYPQTFVKYGLDVSKHAIDTGKKRLPSAMLRTWNVENKFPYPNNFFDFINCNDLIEHLNHPQLTIDNIYKVLKPGGYLYLTTPNKNFIRRLFLSQMDAREHHISLFNHYGLMKILTDKGFKIIQNWTFSNSAVYVKLPKTLGIESTFICQK
jgi:SAM-dependent methyltransferase